MSFDYQDYREKHNVGRRIPSQYFSYWVSAWTGTIPVGITEVVQFNVWDNNRVWFMQLAGAWCRSGDQMVIGFNVNGTTVKISNMLPTAYFSFPRDKPLRLFYPDYIQIRMHPVVAKQVNASAFFQFWMVPT